MFKNRSKAGLTWHNNSIPADELWLKLGGHGSFKFNMQLCNVTEEYMPYPMCMAGDCTTNLHTVLDMYKEQVRELNGMKNMYMHIFTIMNTEVFNFLGLHTRASHLVGGAVGTP